MKTVTLYIADSRELAGRETSALPLLTDERRAQVERIKPQEERLLRIAAGLLLRRVMGVASDTDLRSGEFGKPKLAGEGPHFNLSHGGSYAVLAVGDMPLGVDLEPIADRIPHISGRFLHPDEAAVLEQAPTPECFAELWTKLESVLKADGRGFAFENRPYSVIGEDCPWTIRTFIHGGHVISCAAGEEFALVPQILSVDELIR